MGSLLASHAIDKKALCNFEKEQTSEGHLRPPILDVETALAKYGKETHH